MLAAVEKHRTAGVVSVSKIAHSRILLTAGLDSMLATRVKRATFGFIRRIWYCTRDAVKALTSFFSTGKRRQQRLSVRVFRVFENILPDALFGDDAGIHDADAIGNL